MVGPLVPGRFPHSEVACDYCCVDKYVDVGFGPGASLDGAGDAVVCFPVAAKACLI